MTRLYTGYISKDFSLPVNFVLNFSFSSSSILLFSYISASNFSFHLRKVSIVTGVPTSNFYKNYAKFQLD